MSVSRGQTFGLGLDVEAKVLILASLDAEINWYPSGRFGLFNIADTRD